MNKLIFFLPPPLEQSVKHFTRTAVRQASLSNSPSSIHTTLHHPIFLVAKNFTQRQFAAMHKKATIYNLLIRPYLAAGSRFPTVWSQVLTFLWPDSLADCINHATPSICIFSTRVMPPNFCPKEVERRPNEAALEATVEKWLESPRVFLLQ